jgi:rhodanese-related sulfurtransferase
MGAVTITISSAGGASKMTQEELREKLGDPDLVVVDVRAESSWRSSKTKIKGAVREDPKGVEAWAHKYPKDKTLVFYCS